MGPLFVSVVVGYLTRRASTSTGASERTKRVDQSARFSHDLELFFSPSLLYSDGSLAHWTQRGMVSLSVPQFAPATVANSASLLRILTLAFVSCAAIASRFASNSFTSRISNVFIP